MIIKVLIVDDHALIRMGMKKLLSERDGIKVIGEADSGETALRMVRDEVPDVVLMDLKMPGIGGLEATRKLRHSNPDLKIIALTGFNDPQFLTHLIQAGASGYLTKGSDIDEVVKAIQKVYMGQQYINPELAQHMAFDKRINEPDNPFEKLSGRELEIASLITSGEAVSSIAKRFSLAPKTVNTYRYRIFEKLEIKNDVDLTRLAYRYGIIDENNPTSEDED